MVDTPSAFSFVGVMVIPLLASVAIFTLFPGFIKPTLLPFACKIQPLALIASTTFLVLAKYRLGESLVQILPSLLPSADILAVLALNVKVLPLRATLIVSVSVKETVSPPLTCSPLPVSDPSLRFHAAAFLTASVFMVTLKVVLRTPSVVSSFELIVIELSGEVTLYFTIPPTTAFNCATFTASESALPGARLVSWRVVVSLPRETAPAVPLIVFFTLSKIDESLINLTGA